MAGLTLTSLGGAGTVTGSKHLVQSDTGAILVDCGMFQGLKNLREANWRPLPIDAAGIDAVVLTHAHLDHSGYLPRLVREGFHGRIHATPATREVAEIILRDSAHLQQRDAEFANRIKSSRHRPALPLYDADDVEATMQLFTSHPLHRPFEVVGGATVTFRDAGHILGAATVTLQWQDRTVAFTGDLGRYDDRLMFDPEPITEADYLVTEGTYGDRRRVEDDPATELERIVTGTVAGGGTVVIPAFAVGRSQTILYHLWQLRRAGRLPAVPIYIDSPMAIAAGKVLGHHPDGHRLSVAETEEMFSIATCTPDVEQSKEISADRHPKIVISASGMATGGRILHHLAAFAPDPRNTVVLAGYQSVGTRGRSLADGAQNLKLFGEWVPIAARIENLHMFSAHADSDELLRWMGGFTREPKQSFIVHAEPQSAEELRHRMRRELGWTTTVSVQNRVYAL